MHTRSLFWWIARRLLLVLAIAGAILFFRLFRFVDQTRDEQQQVQLRLAADLAADLLTARLSVEGDRTDYRRFCRELARLADARATVIAPSGAVLGDSTFGAHASSDLTARPEVREALSGKVGAGRQKSAGTTHFHVAAPVVSDGRIAAVLRLSQPRHAAIADGNSLTREVVVTVLILLLLLLVGALTIRQKVERQVQSAAERLLRFAGGDLAARLHGAETAEFLALANAFDEMADRLSAQVRELRLEKRQWQALFTGMREGIIAVDKDLNLMAVNQAARLFLGLDDASPLVGSPLFMAVRNAGLNQFIHEVLRSDLPHRERELEIRSAGGGAATYRLSGVRFAYEAETEAGVLVVMHDITRIKRLEDMRKDFVANVSHELKTPLTAMKGFIETLGDCLPEAPEQAAGFVAIIAGQTERLNAIIDDLLTLSRLEQADHWVAKDFETRDLRETATQAVALCRPLIERRRAEVRIEVPAYPLYANHRLLEQALTNLVDNAVKYSPEATPVVIGLDDREGQVAITVTDRGIGIPGEHLERIFERFHRVDKSRDRQTGGTGLGLSIVKHIARVHGGAVTVTSEVGRGSTFALRLPKRQSAPRAA